jgi:hypothetical protein
MAGAGDPVATGFAESVAKPGGNVTRQSSGGPEVAAKSLPPPTLTALGPERPIEADGNTLITLPLWGEADVDRSSLLANCDVMIHLRHWRRDFGAVQRSMKQMLD